MDALDPISIIFHEKQEGSLCAQHCLNALLQGNYFTAVELAAIGRQLDEVERQRMAEAGVNSEEYKRFIQQPSSNYDDSGFFSIQVIQKAVRVWNLELIPFTSSDVLAVIARENPRSQQAYICNFREHWFTIRKLGNQWFNLNSLLTQPELVSDTYLSLLLTQLQQEGYSIFIVVGSFPESEADQMLKVVTAVQPIKPKLITEVKEKSSSGSSAMSHQTEDPELAMALEESKRLMEEDDQSLKRALAMSLEGLPPDFQFPLEQLTGPASSQSCEAAGGTSQPQPNAEDLREKRLAFYQKDPASSGTETVVNSENVADVPSSSVTSDTSTQGKSTEKQQGHAENVGHLDEEQMLELALKMSMEEGS